MSVAMDRVRQYLGGENRRWLSLAIVLVSLTLPILSPSNADVATRALIFGLFAISVDIALGYTGLITLAPAAFFGVGAYSLAKVVVDYDMSFWLGFPVAVLVGAVLAFCIGYVPIKRRIGLVYFALFTMAFGVIMYDFTYVTTSFTGGSNGLGYVSVPTVAGLDLGDTFVYYYFALFSVAIVATGLYYLIRSDYGDILHATRQNELRMRYLGYDTDREKLLAWIISGSVSALAGALYIGTVGVASPSLMSFSLTGQVIIWVVVGGAGTFVGPFVAAFVLTLLRDQLGSLWAEGYLIVLGTLFVAFIFLFPEGIMGYLREND